MQNKTLKQQDYSMSTPPKTYLETWDIHFKCQVYYHKYSYV